jgi:hypothetical protein
MITTLILIGALLVLMSVVGYVGLVEGRVRGYQAAYDELGASHVAPMLLCRCQRETEPLRRLASHEAEIASMTAHVRQRAGRLN